MSHITLIRPPAVSSRHAYSVMVVPPLGPAYVAGALLGAGHAVTAVDALGEAPLERTASAHAQLQCHGLSIDQIVARVPSHTAGIGISVMFSQQWPDVEALLLALRRAFPRALLFVGGEHPTATWRHLLSSCRALDACVLGEGEATACELADWLDGKGALEEITGLAFRDESGPRLNPARPRLRALDRLARPAWHLFPVERYLSEGFGHGVDRGRSMPMLATRGCPYRCTFCSSPQMWTTRYYLRDVADVVDEIAELVRVYRISNVDFEDLTAIIRRDWILAFCAELERRGLEITYQLPSGTRCEALDGEVLRALSRTGCRNITYAPESGSPRTLKTIKKKLRPERVLESMRVAKQVGINLKANLMIGFPDETRVELLRTLWFGLRAAWIGVDDLPLFPFSAYPGTELYDDLRREGRLPPPDNDFYASLGYMDLTATQSHCRAIGSTELNLYRIGGMSAFYAVGYLRRPWRAIRTLGNLVRGRSETVLEQSLVGLLRRRGARRASSPAPPPPAYAPARVVSA
jgi:radical SAM superfamily enzyme YgiQ (UPF0313 family)